MVLLYLFHTFLESLLRTPQISILQYYSKQCRGWTIIHIYFQRTAGSPRLCQKLHKLHRSQSRKLKQILYWNKKTLNLGKTTIISSDDRVGAPNYSCFPDPTDYIPYICASLVKYAWYYIYHTSKPRQKCIPNIHVVNSIRA